MRESTSSPTEALLAAGIDPARFDPGAVDRWQRLPLIDKPHGRDGAAKVMPDGAVLVRNWLTGEDANWQPGRDIKPPSADELRRREAARAAAEAERRAERLAATELAANLWRRARPAAACHPYLRRKQLPPTGLREIGILNGWRGRWLIAALYGCDTGLGRIINIEGINEDGQKRPVRHAQRSGAFGLVGRGVPTDQIVLAEGWATAAALSMAIGLPVVFATSASNLLPVAEFWRHGRPDARIIIAADHDASATGIEAARAAARAVRNAEIRQPIFDRHGDWCDLHQLHGTDAVRRAWGE